MILSLSYRFGGHSDGVTPGLVSIPEVKSFRVLFVYYGFRSMGISFSCQPFFIKHYLVLLFTNYFYLAFLISFLCDSFCFFLNWDFLINSLIRFIVCSYQICVKCIFCPAWINAGVCFYFFNYSCPYWLLHLYVIILFISIFIII